MATSPLRVTPANVALGLDGQLDVLLAQTPFTVLDAAGLLGLAQRLRNADHRPAYRCYYHSNKVHSPNTAGVLA